MLTKQIYHAIVNHKIFYWIFNSQRENRSSKEGDKEESWGTGRGRGGVDGGRGCPSRETRRKAESVWPLRRFR